MDGGQGAQDSDHVVLVAQCLAEGDWRGAYGWCKGWIGSGGGAGLIDPWLGYVASGLLRGQPRTAVHAVDLALGTWLYRPADRSVVHWARSRVIRNYLKDPKTALPDLALAAGEAPSWLRPAIVDDVALCEADAVVSRKRKPSVGPAPAFAPSTFTTKTLASPGAELPPDGTKPLLWEALRPFLDGPASA